MISDPIYDSIEDARIGKVSPLIAKEVANSAPQPAPKVVVRKTKLSANAKKAAREKATEKLKRLAENLNPSF
jgi:hypothetical protein